MTTDMHPDTGLPRPGTCCGVCPPFAGGGWDCTCEGNPRCQTAADRPSVTDNARAEALEAAAAQFDHLYRDGLMPKRAVLADLAEWADRSRRGIRPNGREWAAGRAETTTEDAAQVIESTRHYNGSRSFIVPADAARALMDAGLLATARTRHTETEWRVRYPDGDGHRISEAVARDPWPLVEGAVVERREVTAWTEADQPTETKTRTTTEWGVRGYRNSDRTVFFSGEDSARHEARTHGGAVIRQQVTIWPEGE